MTLSISHLSVRYGPVQVLHDVSFSLSRGEVICIIGPNGSGKSTLIKTIAGIVNPESGSLSLDGINLREITRNEIAKKIGYVPQDFHYLTSSTVLETVILGRKPYVQWSLSEKDLNQVEYAMNLLDISPMAEKILTEISGGERQRVFIARAIAQEPDFFLFDEPTSALDIRHQIEVFSLIRKLSGSGSHSVLVAVHDLNFAYHFADRVILLNNGKIVSVGSSDEVMTKERIMSVYGVPMQFIDMESGRYVLPEWNYLENSVEILSDLIPDANNENRSY